VYGHLPVIVNPTADLRHSRRGTGDGQVDVGGRAREHCIPHRTAPDQGVAAVGGEARDDLSHGEVHALHQTGGVLAPDVRAHVPVWLAMDFEGGVAVPGVLRPAAVAAVHCPPALLECLQVVKVTSGPMGEAEGRSQQ